MPDEVDTMFSVREVPWHGLGKVLPEEVDAAGAIVEAGLDWKASIIGLTTVTGAAVPNNYGVVREDTGAVLSVVGNRYRIFQNSQVAEFATDLLDSADLKFVTGGALREGARIWLLARLPEDVLIGGVDAVTPYLLLANGHDGLLSLTVLDTPVRVVCSNTLRAAISGATRAYKVKHTTSMEGRIQEARKALRMSFRYYEAFTEFMTGLANTNITDTQVEAAVNDMFALPNPNTSTEEERANVAKRRLALLGLYANSPTVDRGTVYGAYNAATEWYDHYKNARRTMKPQAIERHVENVWYGDGVEFKDKALDLLVAAAGS